jgi:hypothetical protein
VICMVFKVWSPVKIQFYIGHPIVFPFRANSLIYLGTILRFSWNGYYVSHWMLHDNRHMYTSADVSKIQILPIHVKCWIQLKPVLDGVDGCLHLTVPFLNRLNQAKPATFSILVMFGFVYLFTYIFIVWKAL